MPKVHSCVNVHVLHLLRFEVTFVDVFLINADRVNTGKKS
jgi:hypothetical protein